MKKTEIIVTFANGGSVKYSTENDNKDNFLKVIFNPTTLMIIQAMSKVAICI